MYGSFWFYFFSSLRHFQKLLAAFYGYSNTTIDLVTSLLLYLVDQMSVGKMVFYQNGFTYVLLFQQNDFQIFLLRLRQHWSKSWWIGHFDFISLLLKGHLQKFLSLSMAMANTTFNWTTSLFWHLVDQMSFGKIIFDQKCSTIFLLFRNNDFQIFLLRPRQHWNKSWCIGHFDFISLLPGGHSQNLLR
jgi:hypothetical protein